MANPSNPATSLAAVVPPGSRNKKSLLPQEVLGEYGERLIRKSLNLALKGDSQMLRMFMGYVLPKNSEPPVKIGPLRLGTPEELLQTYDSVMEMVAAGQITLSAAKDIIELIEARRLIIETKEHELRLKALEQEREAEKQSRMMQPS